MNSNDVDMMEVDVVHDVEMEEPQPEEKETTVYKRVRVPSTVRHSLWKDYFGSSTKGVCQCCKREAITIMNFEAGHVVSVKNGGSNHLSNLKPVCSHCNKSMGAKNMIEFIKNHFT